MSGPNLTPFGTDVDISDLANAAQKLVVSGGVAMIFPEIGYIHTDGTVRKAQSDGTEAEAGAAVLCLSTVSVASGSTGLFLGPGNFIDGLSGGTAGALAYLSPTAGALTTTLPVSPTANFSKIIGRWLSATLLHFLPDYNAVPLG